MKKLTLPLFSLACSVLVLASCSILPATGPNRQEIYASSSEDQGTSKIIAVTKSLAEGLRVPTGYGFPSSFLNAGVSDYELISKGDILTVTVWENVDNGVFATLGSRVTTLQPMKVNANGNVFMPYVGTIKASGKSPEQVRRQITNALASQTPQPQVEVSRQAGTAGSVRIFSTTGGGGLVPFDEGNLTLASMLAGNGGIGNDPQSTRITVTRGGASGTILAQDLIDNPSYDIALRNDDRITIEADRRYYRLLGQGGGQNLIDFDRADMSLLDAISANGGLNASVADPSGIFIFRTVSAEEATLLLRDQQYYSPQNFVFTVDLRQPDGLFLADAFQIRDRDTIYITEAPFVQWTRVISSLTQAVGTVTSLQSSADTIANVAGIN